MASTSETGHTKNIAHYETLISFCTGYGVIYNPSNNALKIATMQAQLTAAKQSMTDLSVANTTGQVSVNAREIAFQPLKKMATRVINALAVSGASATVIADAKTYNRKIQGKRAKPVKTTPPPKGDPGNPPVADTVSVSQQSYDKLIEHLSGLIELLTQEPGYNPNEVDLKIVSLQAFRDDLIAKNSAVINTATPASNQQISRNQILYTPGTGLVDTALNVKNYVKSVFGAGSLQHNQVKGLQFRMYAL